MREANPTRYETTVQEDGAIIHTPVEHIEGPATEKPAEQPIIKLSAEHVTSRSASAPNQPPVFPLRVTTPPRRATPPTIAIHLPPQRATAPGPVQPRETAVMPRPTQAQRPVANFAPPAERKQTSFVALGLVGFLAISGITAWNWKNSEQPAPKNTAMNNKVAQPGTTTPDDLSNLQTSLPSPTDLSLVMPIVQGKASKPAKPNKTKAPGAKLNTVIPSPRTSHEAVIIPPLTWQPTAPLPTNSHNTPTPTTPETSTMPTTPTLELSPSATSSRLLLESIDTTRKQELLAQYPELVNYLDLKSLAANGELNALNKSAIIDHQKIMDAYSNPSVHEALGDPVWLSENTLKTMAGSGDSPASQLVANSDNALRGAQALYQNQSTGDLAAKIPYLNGDYAQTAIASLQNGESLSVPVAENAVVLDAQRAILPDGSRVELVAIVAYYTQDSTTKTIFTWKLAEPNMSSIDKFVGVTVHEKELAAVTSITPASTPATTPDATPSPVTTPDSTPTTADQGNFLSNFLGSIFGNNNNDNNKGHERKHGHN